jgi:ribokinase
MRHRGLIQSMSASSTIVVIGSSNTDMIVRTPTLPRPGETLLGGEFITAAGGKGANQAVAARRAGGQVAYVARIGSDMFGDLALAGWRQEGIDVSHVSQDPKAPSGVALIFVSHAGENSISVAGGANNKLSPALIKKAAPLIRSASTVLMQLETPLETIQAAAEIAAKAGVRVILNPAPAQPLSADLLKLVDVLTPNETEAELLTGIRIRNEKEALKAAAALQLAGAKNVIITLGSKGALVAAASAKPHFIPAFQVTPVDTTAAGDTFNGALAVALGEGRDLVDAARFASAAAAISITRMGAQPSAPKRKEIEKLLRNA